MEFDQPETEIGPMKKRYTEERIIGFLREAGAGLPIKGLCSEVDAMREVLKGR